MKSEILYAHVISYYRKLPEDIRFDLAHIAEEELFISHLSFRGAFKSSPLEESCLGKEAYKRMMAKLVELDNKKLHDSNRLLSSFGKDYGSGMGGRTYRDIYSTNDDTKLIIIDEAEDRDHAILTDQIVSLILDISPEDRKLIEQDVSKLEQRR